MVNRNPGREKAARYLEDLRRIGRQGGNLTEG
jgi:hypothetical protein